MTQVKWDTTSRATGRAAEKAQWVKCWPHKRVGLGFDSPWRNTSAALPLGLIDPTGSAVDQPS